MHMTLFGHFIREENVTLAGGGVWLVAGVLSCFLFLEGFAGFFFPLMQ